MSFEEIRKCEVNAYCVQHDNDFFDVEGQYALSREMAEALVKKMHKAIRDQREADADQRAELDRLVVGTFVVPLRIH
ncbi:MAG: hypothetical protein IT285_16215 [Bdellovibrionales bacterium]|nr:hypothetical protein [Bdellovibrionales bacterium]